MQHRKRIASKSAMKTKLGMFRQWGCSMSVFDTPGRRSRAPEQSEPLLGAPCVHMWLDAPIGVWKV